MASSARPVARSSPPRAAAVSARGELQCFDFGGTVPVLHPQRLREGRQARPWCDADRVPPVVRDREFMHLSSCRLRGRCPNKSLVAFCHVKTMLSHFVCIFEMCCLNLSVAFNVKSDRASYGTIVIHTHTHIRIHTQAHKHAGANTHTHTHTYIHTHAYTHIRTHTHTHTHSTIVTRNIPTTVPHD